LSGVNTYTGATSLSGLTLSGAQGAIVLGSNSVGTIGTPLIGTSSGATTITNGTLNVIGTNTTGTTGGSTGTLTVTNLGSLFGPTTGGMVDIGGVSVYVGNLTNSGSGLIAIRGSTPIPGTDGATVTVSGTSVPNTTNGPILDPASIMNALNSANAASVTFINLGTLTLAPSAPATSGP
jgi:hypothetical protein